MTSGRNIMIVGSVFVFLAQIYWGLFGNAPGIAMIFTVFGAMIVGIGYGLMKWENSWIGRRENSGSDQHFSPGDRSVAIVPPPHKLPVFDPETGRRLCSFYFYDVNNRLPCLSGCEYPNAKHGACCRDQSIPTCPYPRSREPMVKALMPKPVAWCPGPGGCLHFNELEYVCRLKLKGFQTEFIDIFSRKTQNRKIGMILILTGCLPLIFPILNLVFNVGSDFQTMSILPGIFIAAIGGVVFQNAE